MEGESKKKLPLKVRLQRIDETERENGLLGVRFGVADAEDLKTDSVVDDVETVVAETVKLSKIADDLEFEN